MLDLSGRAVDPLVSAGAKALVFLFVSVDCPISNSYAPEFRRLQTDFAPKKALFRLIYPNRDESAEAVKKHLKEFDLPLTAWRDPELQLTRAAGVAVTPEAAVFVPGLGFVYHGRIDNRNQELGLSRPEATSMDLRGHAGRRPFGQTRSAQDHSRHRLLHLKTLNEQEATASKAR